MTDRMRCQQAMNQFFAYLDRALEGQSLEALERHVEACLDCCDRLQFSRRVDAFVKDRLEDAPLPEGLEDRLRQGLQAARGAGKR
jgi:anti-sigma factor (TIGR02949 family)